MVMRRETSNGQDQNANAITVPYVESHFTGGLNATGDAENLWQTNWMDLCEFK